jgi:hypothetical protein
LLQKKGLNRENPLNIMTIETQLWQPKPRAPLGQVSDLAKEQADNEAEILEKVKYTSIRRYPFLVRSFHIAEGYLNNLREQHGLEAVPFRESDVRLVEKEDYQKASNLVKIEDSGGFFHKGTGYCFIKLYPERTFVLQRVLTVNMLTHELVHKAMKSGLNEFSTHLNEGITDIVNRDIMTKHILPKIL